MNQSLFLEYIKKYFKAIVLQILVKINDTKNPLTYLHKSLLKKDFSVSGKWESMSQANTAIVADIVSMDSQLPLKNRPSIGKTSGEITKMGLKMNLNETQLTNLMTMIQVARPETDIVAKLFDDTKTVITAIYERIEAMFLMGLSSGVTLVDTDSAGIGVRIDFGYKSDHKFGATILWSNAATAKPLDDIKRLFDKVRLDGNVINVMYIDYTAFNNMVVTTQFKERYAFSLGYVGSTLLSPLKDQAVNLLKSIFGLDDVVIVDRSVRYEKNGVQTSYKPWQDGSICFAPTGIVGSLIYAQLAEQALPTDGVSYETIDDFLLVSKYGKNDPKSEVTSSQARVIPVISNVDQIYLLDSKTVQA